MSNNVTIEVTRNIQRQDEMSMNLSDMQLRAEVISQNGVLTSVANGYVTMPDGMVTGPWSSHGEGSLTVNMEGVTDRTVRESVYGAVEDFIAAARTKVASFGITTDTEGDAL